MEGTSVSLAPYLFCDENLAQKNWRFVPSHVPRVIEVLLRILSFIHHFFASDNVTLDTTPWKKQDRAESTNYIKHVITNMREHMNGERLHVRLLGTPTQMHARGRQDYRCIYSQPLAPREADE